MGGEVGLRLGLYTGNEIKNGNLKFSGSSIVPSVFDWQRASVLGDREYLVGRNEGVRGGDCFDR